MDAKAEEEAAPPPDVLLRALKACTRREDLFGGNRLHAASLKRGVFARHLTIANGFINFYSKLGKFSIALRILEELVSPDVVSWTSLISGYTEHGFHKPAIRCFEKMQFHGLPPNAVTFSCALKACSNMGELGRGQELHSDLVAKGLLKESCLVGGSLVDMYVKCGALTQAQTVFDCLPSHNVVTWTSIIAGYCEHQQGEQALSCLQQMKWEGLYPNAVTYACILRVCGSMSAIDRGTEVHADVVQMGFLEVDSVLGNSLLDMYCRCGALEKAQQVFNDLKAWDIVSWNVLMTGYAQSGYGNKALCCFESMRSKGFLPNLVTFSVVLQACGNIGASDVGMQVHSEVSRQGLLNAGNDLTNTLIHMYINCRLFTEAQQIFDDISNRDVISWNIMISGYCQHEECEEGLDCYNQMLREGIFPDVVTFVCLLKACGSTGAFERGLGVHIEVVRKDLFGKETILGNALVDMYAKCGTLLKVQEVFDELPVKTLVAWTSLIAGLCDHGKYRRALMCFSDMEYAGICPDFVTLSCILKACTSIEATQKGQSYYETASANYGIMPSLKHQTFVVDFLHFQGKLTHQLQS